jgi:hypothetical protein
MARMLRSLLASGLLIALVSTVAAEAAVARKPVLSLVRTSPALVLRGTHFSPAKRVRLTLTFDGTRTAKLVRSNTSGAFLATFAAPKQFDACSDSFVVIAVGPTGERATAKFVPRECPPAP